MKRQKIPNHGDKWRNQEEQNGLQPPFAKSLRNITPKFKGLSNPTNSKPPPAKSGCALDRKLNDPQLLTQN